MHLVYSLDRLRPGGAQRQAVELALRLAADDDTRVSLLHYGEDDFFVDRLREGRVSVVHLPRTGRNDWRFPLRIRAWMQTARPDLVHSFLLGPIFWNTIALATIPARRRPVHVAAERNDFKWLPERERRLKRHLYPRAQAVTANSQVAARELCRLSGLAPARVHYLPNGIDLEAWSKQAQAPPPFDVQAEVFNLAVIGRLTPQKNQRVVVEALRQLGSEGRKWRVWMLGDDRTHPGFAAAVRDDIRAAGLAGIIRMLPPDPRVASIMTRMTAVLMPSVYEGFPNVLLEAMALGVPVLAAPVGEVPYLVTHRRNGLVLADSQAASVAAALRELAGMSAAERSDLGRRAQAHIRETYAMERVAARHRAFYSGQLSRG